MKPQQSKRKRYVKKFVRTMTYLAKQSRMAKHGSKKQVRQFGLK